MSLERRTQALLDLIEADRRQRCEALLREAEAQALATVDQAQATLVQGLPDAVVTGIEASDPACALLLQDLRARQPGLRVVEIVRQAHSFAISLPGSGVPACVGRDDLTRTLVPALAQELSMPG